MSIWNDAPKNSQVVFEYLKLLAKRMRTESYGEIAKATGARESREVAPVALRFPLGFIRDSICRPRGLPLLNAIAVNQEAWLPGDSFLPEGVAFGDDQEVLCVLPASLRERIPRDGVTSVTHSRNQRRLTDAAREEKKPSSHPCRRSGTL